MAAIMADDIFKCISFNEIESWFKFHWNLFPGVQLTISIASGNGLAPSRRQAITSINADPGHWCAYAALRGDELNRWYVAYSTPISEMYLIWLLQNSKWQDNGTNRQIHINSGRTNQMVVQFPHWAYTFLGNQLTEWDRIDSLLRNPIWSPYWGLKWPPCGILKNYIGAAHVETRSWNSDHFLSKSLNERHVTYCTFIIEIYTTWRLQNSNHKIFSQF